MIKKRFIFFILLIILLIVLIFYGALLRHHYNTDKKVDRFPRIQAIAVYLAEIPFKIKYGYYKKEEITKLTKHLDKPRFKRFKEGNNDFLIVLPRYSGDKKNSVVEIIDPTNFTVLHEYSHNFKSMNDKIIYEKEHKFSKKNYNKKPYEYRNALILEDGSMIAHRNYAPLFKLDFCSNLIWINQEEKFRHNISLGLDNTIWTATQMYPYSKVVQKYKKSYGLFDDDAITMLNKDGKILFTKSVLEILSDNNMVDENIFNFNNPLYINDVEPALSDTIFWKRGDVFISSKGLSAIIHYRPETNKVINFIKGPFYMQHDVNIIDDSKISIFNNNNTLKENSKYSEVIIYDFEKKIFTKKFNDQLISNNFKTPTSGISRILNDGSLYVEEQKHGRILFFNPYGELEWEYINKDMKGDIYGINWSRVIENKKYKQSLLDLIKKKNCK